MNDLNTLENAVEQARQKVKESAWEWACALAAIHDSRLYPGIKEPKGWERYVRERWNIRRSTAYHIIAWVHHEVALIPSLEQSNALDSPKTPPATPVHNTARASRTARQAANNGQQKPRDLAEHSWEPHEEAPYIISLAEQGLNSVEIAERSGVDGRAVRHVIEREAIYQKGFDAGRKYVPPEHLELSQAKKLERVIEQTKRALEAEFYARVGAAVNRTLESRSEEWLKERAIHERVMKNRHGCMKKETFRLIQKCLHPDSLWSLMSEDQKATFTDAFRSFKSLEKLLLDEKDSPTTFSKIPKNRAEWNKQVNKETK